MYPMSSVKYIRTQENPDQRPLTNYIIWDCHICLTDVMKLTYIRLNYRAQCWFNWECLKCSELLNKDWPVKASKWTGILEICRSFLSRRFQIEMNTPHKFCRAEANLLALLIEVLELIGLDFFENYGTIGRLEISFVLISLSSIR